MDLLLSRVQKRGSTTIELRVEAQNALNTPPFAAAVSSLTDSNFGRIITGGGERRLQLGVRWGFEPPPHASAAICHSCRSATIGSIRVARRAGR